MFLSVADKRLLGEALQHRVIDRDTGQVIRHVIWADDVAGKYGQVSEDGGSINVCAGNIMLERVPLC